MSRKKIAKLIPNLLISRTHLLNNLNFNVCVPNINHFRGLKRQIEPILRTKRHISTMILLQSDRYSLPKLTCFKTADFQWKAHYSGSTTATDIPWNDNIVCSDQETRDLFSKDVHVLSDFVSEEEERQLIEEVEPYLRRLRYENNHWDDAIHGYRETERKIWSEKNKKIIQRVRDTAFPPGTPQLANVHVLDLKTEGYIKAHVDAVKFCGNTIAGISLLSPAIMRLVNTEDKTKYADILLGRRSLYIMKDLARYNYTHEILPDLSNFKGKIVQKDRRISIICRNEP